MNRLLGCECCGLTTSAPMDETAPTKLRCPRCGHPLDGRKPNSLQRTWAFLAAAALLYLPSNLLPIMSTANLFGRERFTITGGIGELWDTGDWGLAVIVFVASIAVPIVKISVLALLAWTAQRTPAWRRPERARLYRVIETVGHWSMLDVYVVVLLSGMVRFGALASVQAEPGLLAFAAVVILTMLAARSFDPRLIWQEHGDDE
ncbi:paraquat-inducible protein A [Piscinibacter sp.]|jgi:paraquat-inducible protein A|uniref:paraquat-inducible protein A n=1 Tax=Piscinibacter sp. TaxID=1903157 RepID=UPI002F3F7800